MELASYYRVAFEQEALGGDFYDVHGGDEEWTAVVGDVCGKGVEAAVLTGKVRQSVRTAALVDRDPGSVEQVPVAGPVPGLMADAQYPTVRVDLGPGETCLFYTDGVPEAPGHRSRFGDDRMREVLLDTGSCDARAQVESVAVALSAHLGDRQHDDIAILAVQSSDTR